MKSLKLILKCSNSLLYSKDRLLKQSSIRLTRPNSANETIFRTVFGSKIEASLTTSNNATAKFDSKQTSCLVDSVKCLSSEAFRDLLICPSELRNVLKEGNCVLVDTRTEKETWRTGVIPGSLCVPLDQLESALNMSPEQFLKKYCAEKPNPDQKIIFVCRRGNRSFKAMKIAQEMGFEKVHSVQGGFMQWFDLQRRIRKLQDENEKRSKEDE